MKISRLFVDSRARPTVAYVQASQLCAVGRPPQQAMHWSRQDARMTKPQAGILVVAALLIGFHSRIAAQQPNAGHQSIAQSGADPLKLDPDTVNVLNANVAARSASLAESAPKGFWIQSR